MAKYSYISGMETRGLTWVFIPISSTGGTSKAGQTSAVMNSILSAYKNFFASVPATNNDALQIIILENLIIQDGRGGFVNAVFFYNPNDPRRLPGDNIRFHDGAQDLPVKPL